MAYHNPDDRGMRYNHLPANRTQENYDRRPIPRFYGPGDRIDVGGYTDNDDEWSYGCSTPLSHHSSDFNTSHNSTPTSVTKQPSDKFEAILLEQQKLLKTVVANQEEIKKKQEKLEEEIQEMKSDKTKAKCERIPRELTNIVSEVISNSDAQLKLDESATNEHNLSVMKEAVCEIMKCPEFSYDKKLVERAVKRSYEHQRRRLKMSEKGVEHEEEILKQKKYRRRKERVYDRRSKYVSKTEKKYWKLVTYDLMTDESDAEGDESKIVLHRHKWRSNYFSKWMQELDRRYAEAMPTKCSISSKKRTEGSPSKSLPPKNCPNWAIDKSWDAQERSSVDPSSTCTGSNMFNFCPDKQN